MEPVDERGGLVLTQEELARALSMRPKIPLTGQEVDEVREVLEWFQQRKVEQEASDIAREKRAKRYPILFGAISALVAIGSLVISLLTGKHP